MLMYKAYGPDGTSYFHNYETAFYVVAGKYPDEAQDEDEYWQLLSIVETGGADIEMYVSSDDAMVEMRDAVEKITGDVVKTYGGAKVSVTIEPHEMPDMGDRVRTPDGVGKVAFPTTDPGNVPVVLSEYDTGDTPVHHYERDEVEVLD